MAKNRAQRRYTKAVLFLSVAYVALLLSVVTWFNHGHPSGPLAYAAAVLPALPLIGVFVALGRYLIEETDEYLRMKVARQALIATGFAMTVATVWGFLETFKLAPHVEAYWAAIMWFAGLGLGGIVNAFTFRDGAC